MKKVVLFISVMTILMASCRNNSISRIGPKINPDSVIVSLLTFSDILYLGELQVHISNKKQDCFIRRWDEAFKQLYLDNTVSKNLSSMIDSILIKQWIPIYLSKKPSNLIAFHEGDILEITSFYKGKKNDTEILLENAYSVEPQYTQNGYEIIYSPKFSLLIQYLYYIMATAYDDQTLNQFIDLLTEISKERNRKILYPSQERINQILTSSSYQSYKKEQEIWLN